MSRRVPRYRWSWKKPWAFENLYDMTHNITEREVYKKLRILERHSAYKRPYAYNSHQRAELEYQGPGGRRKPWKPPYFPPCGFACNPFILDCQAGLANQTRDYQETHKSCDCPQCICGDPPFWIEIKEDPTNGRLEIQGQGSKCPTLCVWGGTQLPQADRTVELKVFDSRGRMVEIDVSLVNCANCCDQFSITGDDTVNPGGDWVGTITPPCPTARCSVAENSDNCDMSCSMSATGGVVYVSVGASDCGTFTVTVEDHAVNNDCKYVAASKTVRINDTGQGGSWVPYCNHTTVDCPRAGCDTITETSGQWQVESKCGSLGADCKPDNWGFECEGDSLTAADCDCDGSNQVTAYIWECPSC